MFSMPLPKEDSEGSEKAPKITNTTLCKETVDGHPCTKNNVVITDSAGQSTEAITWDASDLQGLPIQIQTQEGETTSVVRFKQIQLSPPPADSFEPPSGFTKYDSAEDLKLSVMKKMVDATNKK
jgi:hypothetical protein